LKLLVFFLAAVFDILLCLKARGFLLLVLRSPLAISG
jgi:hypothetical protein